jgi:uncharacterized cupin superfamily protein
MFDFKKPVSTSGLVSWGTPEDVGCKTLEGSPELFGSIALGSLETPIMAGLYKATKGKFEIPYPFHEHACVLEGEVALTDESGETRVFGPGDSWIVRKGETVIWDVRSDYVLKSFFTTTIDVDE